MESTTTDSLIRRTAAGAATQRQDGNMIVDTGDEIIKGTNTVTRRPIGD